VKLWNQQSGIPAGRARSVPRAFFEDVGSMLLGCEDKAEPTVLPLSEANAEPTVLPLSEANAEPGVLLGFADGAEPTVLL
jgi:hypothetical protein